MSTKNAHFKSIPVEEAISQLHSIEIGLDGLDNDFDYFSILNQVNTLLSSIINYGQAKSILGCDRIELLDSSRGSS